MCDTCGCNITASNQHLIKPGGKLHAVKQTTTAVTILQGLLSENDQTARHNRQHFDRHGVLAINLMSSPGSGKTSLLEATLDVISPDLRVAVIEGDLETENDAERIRRKGVTAIQITTGNACHLDAHMIHDALHSLPLEELDIVFIENVGNLVCPASFDLGQHLNVTLLSVTEGDDKPSKYPVMFRAADLVLITKTDLLHVLDDFDVQTAEKNLRNLASQVPLIALSSRQQHGISEWLDWLEHQQDEQLQRLKNGTTRQPTIQQDGQRLHADL